MNGLVESLVLTQASLQPPATQPPTPPLLSVCPGGGGVPSVSLYDRNLPKSRQNLSGTPEIDVFQAQLASTSVPEIHAAPSVFKRTWPQSDPQFLLLFLLIYL